MGHGSTWPARVQFFLPPDVHGSGHDSALGSRDVEMNVAGPGPQRSRADLGPWEWPTSTSQGHRKVSVATASFIPSFLPRLSPGAISSETPVRTSKIVLY